MWLTDGSSWHRQLNALYNAPGVCKGCQQCTINARKAPAKPAVAPTKAAKGVHNHTPALRMPITKPARDCCSLLQLLSGHFHLHVLRSRSTLLCSLLPSPSGPTSRSAQRRRISACRGWLERCSDAGPS